jgi:hypothetical protein
MANQYINAITDLWNNAGTTFYGIKLNVTNTASAAASRLLALQVAGSNKFTVDKDGNVVAAGSLTLTGAFVLGSNDAGALGASGTAWSDLFLASGGVINWAAGDVTITHSTNALAFAGAASGYSFDAVVQPAANDGAALGAAATSWSDLFLASGGVINFANGNWVATHTSGILTVGTGDLRVTTAGTDATSVATVGGTQTLTNKTLTSPTITAPTLSTSVLLTGVITPAQITADQNDYAPTGFATASVLRLDTDAFRNITGIAGGAAGRIIIIQNIGSNILAFSNDDSGSTAANRFYVPSGTGFHLEQYGTAMFYYDGTFSRWVLVSISRSLASQSVMEAATSYYNFVTPQNQHYHPGHPKCWGQTTGAGTPTLQTSYNVTSITDTATGRLTVTIATDFSSAHWAGVASANCATNANRMCSLVSKAAGTVILESSSAATTLSDPGVGWDWAFFGDQ